MLIEQTLDKLHAMKLGAMAEAVQHQLRAGEAATLSFEERLGLLVDTEWTAREQRKLTPRVAAPRYQGAALTEPYKCCSHTALRGSEFPPGGFPPLPAGSRPRAIPAPGIAAPGPGRRLAGCATVRPTTRARVRRNTRWAVLGRWPGHGSMPTGTYAPRRHVAMQYVG